MDGYEFRYVADNLVLIRWYRVATQMDSEKYLKELTNTVENAPHPLYFLSDLRQGHITSARVLQVMGRLTQNPNWAGGIALVEQLSAEVFVRLFGRFAVPEMRGFIFDDIQEALQRLEAWQEGITVGHDWDNLLALKSVE